MNKGMYIALVLLLIGGVGLYTTNHKLAKEKASAEGEEITETRDFGDDGDEGGSVDQDAALVVTESIAGKWQSLDDPLFVREFKTGGEVLDWHDGVLVSSGRFSVTFDEELYIQITSTSSPTLNFQLDKLTPEELELTYLDRGSILLFKRTQ